MVPTSRRGKRTNENCLLVLWLAQCLLCSAFGIPLSDLFVRKTDSPQFATSCSISGHRKGIRHSVAEPEFVFRSYVNIAYNLQLFYPFLSVLCCTVQCFPTDGTEIPFTLAFPSTVPCRFVRSQFFVRPV